MPTDVRATSPRQTSVRHVAHRRPSGTRPARPLAARAANARLVTRGCSVHRWRLVPPDPTARPPCGTRPARPLTVRAASFARRVVSKPGQAPPPPTGTAAAPNHRPRAPQPGPTSAYGHRSQASQTSGPRIGAATKEPRFGLMCSGSALLGETMHPIRRHCTRSDRVQSRVTGAAPRNGCGATQRV